MDLEVVELGLRAADKCLLASLSSRMSPGQFWCVLGKNGAGKSTLLRTLAAIDPVRSGQVFLGGRALSSWPLKELARQRAFLSQQQYDAFSSSVLDTVLSARYPHHQSYRQRAGFDDGSDRLVAMAALQRLGLGHLAQRDVLSLSGGERRQVAMAGVFAQDAALLLLDEPTAHLDLDVGGALFRCLAEGVRQGACVIASVHDPNLAVHFATHVILMMPGGQHLAGESQMLLTTAALSAVFNQTMREYSHQGERWFLPSMK